MKQVRQNRQDQPLIGLQMSHRLREGIFILSVAIALFLLISLSTWHKGDPGWLGTGSDHRVVLNWGGRVGAFLADILLLLAGCIAWLLPLLLVFVAWLALKEKKQQTALHSGSVTLKLTGFLFIILSSCGLLSISFPYSPTWLPATIGGLLGEIIAHSLKHVFNTVGSVVLLSATFLSGFTLLTGVSWLAVSDLVGMHTLKLFVRTLTFLRTSLQKLKEKSWRKTSQPDEAVTRRIEPRLTPQKPQAPVQVIKPPQPERIEKPRVVKPDYSSHKKIAAPMQLSHGMLPPLSLLNPAPPSSDKAFSDVSFEELSHLVEQRLLDFGVEVKVVAVHPGPIITRFELDLAPGIKVSKITGLAKDIARSLSATSVRVVEVIPGKSVIGLELPNQHREVVGLRDILECPRYVQSRSPVSLVLGKDIAGFPVVVDLSKMPHLLVAGTTGSGKSVSINAMLLSMLFKATPEQLRLILIDPKMLELSVYEGIPHLLTPVITDMKDAANALRWCVAEMDRRYRLMAALGVRNLAGYNVKVSDASKQGKPIPAPEWLTASGNHPEHLEALPTIVVVADELADMMMVVGKKVEDLIARIAQKARAAGIHLILATQRPSVDVITGLIKANIPTRIAFQVSSRIDSRTILDQQGAEQLLGNGDMLYMPPGTGVPVRVHGAFVADEEVHRVVATWQTYGKPEYLEEVTSTETETGIGGESGGESDPLYDQALKIVTESRRASISLVQRRLKIGYNRAARIMEDMEAAGVVSTMDSNGTREVLAPPPVSV
ncbi:MAG: DNA translocase FtsK 4TM domain-containing protein [Gammaproteobacteria bacterium]|nr:DNA translocase FtsK 4TM domain-containing protein [Gammaproteobacteria bacterium]